MPDAELDRFVGLLRRRLLALPPEQREDELRELRGHLECLVEECLARGLDRTAAVAEAIERFGAADVVGASLVGAHRQRLLVRYLSFAAFFALGVILGSLGIYAVLGRWFGFPWEGWADAIGDAVFLAVWVPAMYIAVDVWLRRRRARGLDGAIERRLRKVVDQTIRG